MWQKMLQVGSGGGSSSSGLINIEQPITCDTEIVGQNATLFLVDDNGNELQGDTVKLSASGNKFNITSIGNYEIRSDSGDIFANGIFDYDDLSQTTLSTINLTNVRYWYRLEGEKLGGAYTGNILAIDEQTGVSTTITNGTYKDICSDSYNASTGVHTTTFLKTCHDSSGNLLTTISAMYNAYPVTRFYEG